MPCTADKDAEFRDVYFEVSKKEKILIRATVKFYENTGTYFLINLFNFVDKELKFNNESL